MGVHGLWKLLAPTGKPVKLESLEGKVLAVDVSIWLNQAMYGMQGYQGSTRANAHLVVLFNRICKLLHYKIKPIFVFDGAAPELKKLTLNARRKRKELAAARAKRATDRIVKNYLKRHALNELSKDSQSAKGRKPNLSRMLPKTEKDASIFELPPLQEDTKQRSRTILDEKDDLYLDRIDQQKAVEAQFEDINDIDINSQQFRSLPEEIQHEVITNIRESSKKPFWSRFKELPKKADDFSSYQLSRLLKKGKMTHRLDELQKDMKTKTSGDLAVLLDYETRLQAFEAGRVASEDARHYLLIKKQQQKDDRGIKTGNDQIRVRNPGMQSVEDDHTSHRGLDPMDIGDVILVDKYDGHGKDMKARTGDEGGVTSSNKWPPSESVDTQRKNQIKHEVWKFFDQYNSSSVHEGKDDNKGSSYQKIGKIKPNNRIFDEEDLRESDKRKIDETSANAAKKRKHEETCHEEASHEEASHEEASHEEASHEEASHEEASHEKASHEKASHEKASLPEEKKKEKDASSESPLQGMTQPKGFLGRSDVNLSDEYDSDQEEEVIENGRLRKGVVTQTKNTKEDCTIGDEASKDTPVLMDAGTEGHLPSSDQASVHPDTATEGLIEMEDGGKEGATEEIDSEGLIIGRDDITQVEDMQSGKLTDVEIELIPSEGLKRHDLFSTNLEEFVDNDTELEESSPPSQESTLVFDQEDLDVIQEKLDLERIDLEKHRNKDQRMAASVTEAMYSETKELLHLFGIPYIDSPHEAEAQCAFLDLSSQCEGVITDDSDVWLFGGQRVYKNFFTKDKDVQFYHDQAIERQLTLDRCKLINLALLMGSDYTIGIQGVGFVTALEIISEFPGDGIEGLERFRNWWEEANIADIPADDSKIRSKLSKLTLTRDFPSHIVVRAYLDPEVDKSKEKFSWNSPDLDLLRTYAQEKMGWIQSKTDEMLLPVIKRLREKVVQGKISSYFFLKPNVDRERQKIKSKRLQAVLQKLSTPNNENELTVEDDDSEDGEDVAIQRKELKNPHVKDSSRKQSKTSVKKSVERDFSASMQNVEDISDSDESDTGQADERAVARIAGEIESDRGRHVWLGRTNQRKLFAKNNKGYGRSWQKHDWQDGVVHGEGDDLVPSSERVPEDTTTPKKDVKPESYWEDQISDTEYDLDELISCSSVAGKMIGGAAAGKIMTNLEKNYNDDGDEEERDKKEKDGGRRTKTRSTRGQHGKQKIKQRESAGNDEKRTKDLDKQRTAKQRTTKQRSEFNDNNRDSDEEFIGQGKRPSRENQQIDQPNYEEEYRIEDEKEPERNEEDLRIQASRRAKRNPYLKKQAPSRVKPAVQMTIKDTNMQEEANDNEKKNLLVSREENKQNKSSKNNKRNRSDRLALSEKRESLLSPRGASSKRGRGKGKQLVNRKTRFKSSRCATGPALSESSDED